MSAPDVGTVRTALDLARRAPSVHNTQPWSWAWDGQVLQLSADTRRWIPATDPHRRDLLLSCGAVLDHAVLAFRAAGWRSTVSVLPNPALPNHIAAIEFAAAEPTPRSLERVRAIELRCSDRRTYSSWEVPGGLLSALTARAAEVGVNLVPLPAGSAQRRVEEAVAAAQRIRADDRAYRGETAEWTGAQLAAAAGVPAGSLLRVPTRLDNRFPAGDLADRPDADNSELLVLATDTDDPKAAVRAGRAVSAVLLEAATIGLASCPLSEPLELDGVRDMLRAQVLTEGYPQLLVRVGWAPSRTPAPARTGRLPLAEQLTVS